MSHAATDVYGRPIHPKINLKEPPAAVACNTARILMEAPRMHTPFPAAIHAQRALMRRHIGTLQLTCLGLGAMVGVGIFVLTGVVAATQTGPAIVLSFLLAGVVSLLAGLCYARAMRAFPTAGAAYAIAYHRWGSLAGWLVGCLMLLEYGFGTAIVGAGAAAYLRHLAGNPTLGMGPAHLDALAAMIVIAVGILPLVNTKIGHRLQTAAVLVKLGLLIAVLVGGASYLNTAHLLPLIPAPEHLPDGTTRYGWSGIVTGASLVFVALCGHETLTAAAEEVRDPTRAIPRALLLCVSLAICLYVAVALVMLSMARFRQLGAPDALPALFMLHGAPAMARVIAVAGIIGMATVIYSALNASSRTVYAMARSGLLPSPLGQLSGRERVPRPAMILATALPALAAAALPVIKLAALLNFGTLSAFAVVALACVSLPRMRLVALASLLCTGALWVALVRQIWPWAIGYIVLCIVIHLWRHAGTPPTNVPPPRI